MKYGKKIIHNITNRPKLTLLIILVFSFFTEVLFYLIIKKQPFVSLACINGIIGLLSIVAIFILFSLIIKQQFAALSLLFVSPIVLLTLFLVPEDIFQQSCLGIILTSVIVAFMIKEILHLTEIHFSFKKFFRPYPILKVSAVVPNYNYANYLKERVDSIISQKYPIYELIILDDCSTDNSDKVIKQIIKDVKAKKTHLIIKYIPNKKNSGNVFKQWEKCFDASTGDFVWICEADDSCSKYFLNSVMKPFIYDEKVVLSYAESSTIDENGKKQLPNLREWIDIFNTKHWNKSYITDGKKELKHYTCVNNTVANVSSVVFRKNTSQKIPYNKYLRAAQNYTLAGDWYFYSKYFLQGKIAYCSESLNHHRMHIHGVTLSTDKYKQFREIESVQKNIQKDVTITTIARKNIKEYRDICLKGFGLCEKELKYATIPLSKITSKKKDNHQTLLSIIISAYNAEDYIETCLNSVIKALPEKTEVLVIDDGSTDDTARIIKQYANDNSAINYHYKKNGGLSSVKNYGLTIAKGEYIIFMDADDEIKPNGYQVMLKTAIDNSADIVVCDIELVYDTGVSINCPVYHKKPGGLKGFLEDGLMASSNNKMVRKTLFDTVGKYPEGKNNEDVAITPVLLSISQNTQYVHSSFYRYYQRKGSIQHSDFSKDRLVIFDTVSQAIESVKKLKPKEADAISSIIICNQLIAILIYIIIELKNGRNRTEIIAEFCNRYRKLNITNTPYIKEYCTKLDVPELPKHLLSSTPSQVYYYIKSSRQKAQIIDYFKRAAGIKKAETSKDSS